MLKIRKIKKKCIINIPKYISIIYLKKKQVLNIRGPLQQKLLKLKVKILISKDKKTLTVTPATSGLISNSESKNLKAMQGTTVALIKQYILETSNIFYLKLKFVGLGYRVFFNKDFKSKLLLLKLGYSHSIYFKIPNKLKIFCLKLTKLFIFGNSYQQISQTASIIRHYKKPELYKGKGILYETEKIILKEGKKI